MPLDDLDDDELLLFAGMVRQVTCADDQRSPSEMAEFRAIAAEVGRRRFDDAFRRAIAACHTFEQALELAQGVTRPAAREIILTVLVDLAQADGVSPEEAAIVRALAGVWQLPVRV